MDVFLELAVIFGIVVVLVAVVISIVLLGARRREGRRGGGQRPRQVARPGGPWRNGRLSGGPIL